MHKITHALLLTFKAIHGLAPSYITELITIKSSAMGRYALRSNNELLLKPPPCSTTYTTLGDRAFMASAPKLWNALPVEIRNTNTVDRFKRLLKSHYFRLAFDL